MNRCVCMHCRMSSCLLTLKKYLMYEIDMWTFLNKSATRKSTDSLLFVYLRLELSCLYLTSHSKGSTCTRAHQMCVFWLPRVNGTRVNVSLGNDNIGWGDKSEIWQCLLLSCRNIATYSHIIYLSSLRFPRHLIKIQFAYANRIS